MNICVYGASSNKISDTYIKAVEELGEKIALRSHGLVFGAGNEGCMGAAARGARKGGAEITGIAPSFFRVDGVLFDGCTRLVYTETMRERKKLLEESSDAFVVTPGGIGTYDEFFEIMTLKQLERHKKAIAVYNINGYYDELDRVLEGAVNGGFMTRECKDLVRFFTDPDALLDYLENYTPPEIVISNMKHI